MDLSKVCSCLNNTAQIDGTISDTQQVQSTIESKEQILSEFNGLNVVAYVYNGGETKDIEVNVDNENKIITATLKSIQYKNKLNFPNVGSSNLLYVDIEESATYRWDTQTTSYVCVGRDYNQIGVISGGNA